MGNCVIIDHGNSEYSVVAHMQQGSVTVKVGERVAAGQVIGKLGNSGDSFGPHLHYQLQSGPQLFHGPVAAVQVSKRRCSDSPEAGSSMQNRLARGCER